MNDPRQVASQLLGAIDWQTEVSGYCKCPGESLYPAAAVENGGLGLRLSPDLDCCQAAFEVVIDEFIKKLCRVTEIRLRPGHAALWAKLGGVTETKGQRFAQGENEAGSNSIRLEVGASPIAEHATSENRLASAERAFFS